VSNKVVCPIEGSVLILSSTTLVFLRYRPATLGSFSVRVNILEAGLPARIVLRTVGLTWLHIP